MGDVQPTGEVVGDVWLSMVVGNTGLRGLVMGEVRPTGEVVGDVQLSEEVVGDAGLRGLVVGDVQ